MGTNDPCNGGVALFLLKGERTATKKKELIGELINECAAKKNKGSRKGKKAKGEKRPMTGYNCYMKDCAKQSGNFGKCLTDKGWGKLPNDEKESFNKMATEGCNV